MESNKNKREKPPHPRKSANPLSALTFSWLLGTFITGFKRDLEVEDLYEPLKEHRSDYLGDIFEKEWNSQLRSAKRSSREPKLLSVIVKVFFWKNTMYAVILAVSELGIRLVQPFLIGLLVRFFSIDNANMPAPKDGDPTYLGRYTEILGQFHSRIDHNEALFFAMGIVVISFINIFVLHPYMMAILHQGMKMRVACCSLLYRKALRLSKTALGETTVGQVVNLLSNDVNRFDIAVIFLHYLWIAPLETMIVSYFMYEVVGWSTFLGVFFLLLLIPMQGWLGKKMSSYRLKTAIRTDERVRLMNEIISGMQVIKMYTWETPFTKLVAHARKQEIRQILGSSNGKAIIESFYIYATRFARFLTFLAFALAGGVVTAEKMFVITSFYNVISMAMTVSLPLGVAQIAEALISARRIQEMRQVRGSSDGRAVLESFYMFPTRVALFLTLLAYALDGGVVTAEKIFVVTSFYNVLRVAITVYFPLGVTQLAEASVSVHRVQKFLLYDENPMIQPVIDPTCLTDGKPGADPKTKVVPGFIEFEEMQCFWLDEREPTLNNFTTTVKPGQLMAVIGPVGSGKSSLIQAVLHELPVKSGRLTVQGAISYASQEPWLFAGSVRQNILFGLEYDKHRYHKVIEVCALKRDFELLPYGDKTIVGERGISLSGGQRARINLARAIYKPADIYLLDDPLSAVDTHVGKHLFEDCIQGFLRDKTVILVTHQLQYLKNVHHILILNNGVLDAEGSFEQLQSSGLDFAKLLREPTPENEKLTTTESTASIHTRRSSVASTISQMTEEGHRDEPQEVAEQRTKGSVGSQVYTSYFRACHNWFLVFLMFFLFLATQAVSSGSDYWGSKWAQDEEWNHSNKSNMTDDQIKDSTYVNIYIYSGISVVTVVITLVRSFLFFRVCMMASQNLHDNMFSKITRARMRFFHTNPSGRILNRFSKDMGALDELLPQAMIDCFQIFLSLFGIVVMVAVVSPILLIPTAIIAVIFYLFRIFYLRTSRSVKRLEGITRSPVFSHLNATLQGLTTIRAFNAQSILTKEFDSHQDLHSTAWYIFISTSRAFGFWLDFFCVVYVAIVAITFLYWDAKSGADAGLAITQSIALTGMFQWGMRQSAELENQMTSVERVLEYTAVEQEPSLESSKDSKPPPSWPTKGMIEFDQTGLKYDPEAQPVLHAVSFVVKPQEKIGIVGRTGAGKSTLISALFRLAYIEGKITIDSVETSTIGLHDLRSRLSIIPQEPVLFSGTLRKNLDPFDEYPDWMLWQALEEVELKEVVSEHTEGLNGRMSEGGSNFSVGQRQLLCLARAIIRNNRILIMDEATANVDPQTDHLIQRTIRRKFNDCTVLTIAHRLNTVMDSDRILVLDAGKVIELDHPYLLLKNHSSSLYGLVEQTGKSTARKLRSVAKKNYKLKLKREEALRLLHESEETDSCGSGSSRSSSPSPEDTTDSRPAG